MCRANSELIVCNGFLNHVHTLSRGDNFEKVFDFYIWTMDLYVKMLYNPQIMTYLAGIFLISIVPEINVTKRIGWYISERKRRFSIRQWIL